MNTLVIELDREITGRPLEVVDELRRQIIPFGVIVGKEEIFNWSETANPHILYTRPHRNRIRIVGVTPDGGDALDAIGSLVSACGELIFGGSRYKIAGVSNYNDMYLPRSSSKTLHYKTVSPILFFTGNRRKVYEGILNTNGEYGLKDTPKTNEYLKTYALDLIRDDIKNKLKDYLGERNYSFVDKIAIQWEEFSLTHIPYHKDEKLTVGIKGKLSTNFFLLPFIGNKTGKGFGELILMKERGGCDVAA